MESTKTGRHDVVIVGGGPAGAMSALHLLRKGITPLIIEKENFPRYHIGESLTGEAGLCLRELGLEKAMEKARYPVKHGVNVYGPAGREAFCVPVKKRDENNRLQPATTWQVRRSTFDKMLLDVAVERGAGLLPGRAVAPLCEDSVVRGVRVRIGEREEDVRAGVVIDASGQGTFLANAGVTSPKERGRYDRQVAVFSQVTGAVPDPGDFAGDTQIFYRAKNHWAWFIPIDDVVVSVGVVVPASYFTGLKLSPGDFLRREFLALNPALSRRVAAAKFVEDTFTISNYSYHIRQYTGKGFLCAGDSHRFIDPIFSFGLNFAMKEAQLASDAIARYLEGGGRDAGNPFAEYQARSERGQDIVQDLIDVFWDRPLPFAVLVHNQHREEMIDLFAGRIFSDFVMESQALRAMRQCLVMPVEQTS